MNYRRHYNLLIEKAQRRTVGKEVYIERHHIIPRSEGGSDDASNIVKLYPREHFVAHWLLYRENPESVTRAFAFNMMSANRRGTYKPSSRAYAEGVEAAAKANTKNFTGRKAMTYLNTKEVRYVKLYEVEYWEERGWKLGRFIEENRGRFWSNNGTEESFSRELKPGWVKGRLQESATKGKKAVSKNGEVKFVDSPEKWIKDGWLPGNEKYYPGYLHQTRNQKKNGH
jgi:hypothetical protein